MHREANWKLDMPTRPFSIPLQELHYLLPRLLLLLLLRLLLLLLLLRTHGGHGNMVEAHGAANRFQ